LKKRKVTNEGRQTMKKIQLLSITLLSGAIAFGAQAKTHKAQVNFIDAHHKMGQ
jgi:hypothetical protein